MTKKEAQKILETSVMERIAEWDLWEVYELELEALARLGNSRARMALEELRASSKKNGE